MAARVKARGFGSRCQAGEAPGYVHWLCASLPKTSASPPASYHQRVITGRR
jgi:hypothetical protein